MSDVRADDRDTVALAALLDEAVGAGVFPGCVALVWRAGEVRYHGAHGRRASHARARAEATPVTPETVYDLASVTKVLATTTLIAQAIAVGTLELDARLPSSLAPRHADERPRLRDLLEHAAGLAAHREFFFTPWSLGPGQRAALIDAIREVPPDSRPRTQATYSDLGFLLLGAWLEQLHGARLDALFRAEIAAPLGIAEQLGYLPLAEPGGFALERIAVTEVYDDPAVHWHGIRSALAQPFAHGVVHDDNCVVMGGVAGHAGLFGTAAGVLAVARAWLERRLPGVPAASQAELVASFTRPSTVPASTRRLGFDGPSPDGGGSTGGAIGPAGFGHLGYTGTSVWIDPSRDAVYVLLSNRVHPGRGDERIRELRPRFHALAARL